MKKGLFLLSLLFLLTGCGEETKEDVIQEVPKQATVHCELSSRDVINGYETTAEYTIYYTGDYVDKVDTVETIISDSTEILDTMEAYINTTYDSMNDAYGGYTYEVKKEDGKVISNVEIDYTEMDLDQYVTDQPLMANYVKDGKFLLDGIVEIYEDTGATCE